MKHRNIALFLCLTLTAVPAFGITVTKENATTAAKAAAWGGLSLGSAKLVHFLGSVIKQSGSSIVKSLRAKKRPALIPAGELVGSTAATLAALYGTYFFGKKCAQQLGWFTDAPAEETVEQN